MQYIICHNTYICRGTEVLHGWQMVTLRSKTSHASGLGIVFITTIRREQIPLQSEVNESIRFSEQHIRTNPSMVRFSKCINMWCITRVSLETKKSNMFSELSSNICSVYCLNDHTVLQNYGNQSSLINVVRPLPGPHAKQELHAPGCPIITHQ
jgi:hypothetical protein